MKRVGAHVSAAGGVENAPMNAAGIGAEAFAFFTKNQRQWKSPPIPGTQAEAFRKACADLKFPPEAILPHDTYLINMGSPDPEIRRRSEEAFIDELKRCSLLGLKMLNFHPGSHRGEMGDEECLSMIAESVNRAMDRTSGVAAVIENTAGQGGSVGRSFEQIAFLIDNIEDKKRVGVCLDTCHLFAAGYDLSTRKGYDDAMADFDRTVGVKRLMGWHLNDAKSPLGSLVDRHQSLGKGNMGLEPFKFIMNDPRFDGIPLILETPEPDLWKKEISLLHSFEK